MIYKIKEIKKNWYFGRPNFGPYNIYGYYSGSLGPRATFGSIKIFGPKKPQIKPQY